MPLKSNFLQTWRTPPHGFTEVLKCHEENPTTASLLYIQEKNATIWEEEFFVRCLIFINGAKKFRSRPSLISLFRGGVNQFFLLLLTHFLCQFTKWVGHVIGKNYCNAWSVTFNGWFYGFTYITPARRELEKIKLKKTWRKKTVIKKDNNSV